MEQDKSEVFCKNPLNLEYSSQSGVVYVKGKSFKIIMS